MPSRYPFSRPRVAARLAVGAILLLAHLAALGVIGGCVGEAGDDVRAAWAGEREVLGDTVIVRTRRGSVWRDTMNLAPELTIGTLDGDGPYVLGEVRSLDVDDEGRIFVLDGQAREVRVFSPAGRHLRSFGRSGDGPGEFRSPVHLRILPDGGILVRDEWAARFSLFGMDGAYVASWPRASQYSTWLPFYLDAEHRVLNESVPGALVRYELDGTVTDTIILPAHGPPPPSIELAISGGRVSLHIPYSPREHWTIHAGGDLLTANGGRYAFDRHRADGGIFRVERAVPPVPIAQAEADQAREGITRAIREDYGQPDWRWSGAEIPAAKPFFERILPGRDGTIWLFRSGESWEEVDPEWSPDRPEAGSRTRWVAATVADVFDDEGRYLGPVVIPPEIPWQRIAPVLTREHLWAVALSELGVPQVVRYRVE